MKNKSLTFRIFINTFLVGTLVYFICAFMFLGNLYTHFEQQIFNELESESIFLEDYVLTGDLLKLQNLKTKNRITLIHGDGSVYFDNTVSFEKMENHALRSEFLGAKDKGISKLSRYSSTMTEKTLYFAKNLSNGDVLRISCNQHSVWVLVLGMSQILLLILVIAVVISGISATWISKKIVNPLNSINLDEPLDSDVYEELKPFTKRIAEENFEKAQREEIRAQYTANVSHELKTPLTSISGFAEILMQGGTDPKITIDFSKSIYDEAQRMTTLVNDIIKLSKLDEKSIAMEKEALSLRTICREVMEVLSASAKAKNLSLNLEGDSGLINGVEPVIYEMVYNLVDNAIKYNKIDGSVNINIQELSNNVGDKNKVVLSVHDTGIGIPAVEKDRIFERFYRIDKSRSRSLGGTGLGLSIAYTLIKVHGGNIKIMQENPKGTRVIVKI